MDGHLLVEPLTTTIGASVRGVDLREPIAADIGARICEDLYRHAVLVFPDQPLTLEQQSSLASLFGPLEPLPSLRFLGRDATVTLDVPAGSAKPNVSSVPRPWADFQGWHTDSSFTEKVPRAAVLCPEIIAPVGGGTAWTNMCAAYEALSPTLRDWLVTLNAVHQYPDGYKEAIGFDLLSAEVQRRFDEEFPPREHPVVFEHPETGRRGLFVNPSYTLSISGLSARESRTILAFLFDHVTRSDFVYRHRWKTGDIVVWDELATLHLAPDDFAPHPRRLVRVTAGLVKPSLIGASGRVNSRT